MPLFTKLLPEHVVEKLPEAVCNPGLEFDEEAESLPVYNGETGELLFKSRVPGARRVSRQRLRALLAKDLDDAGIIRWGKRLAEFSEGGASGPVQLRFEDGSTYDADYVLGTDGSSSKVRELLFNGDETGRVQLSGYMFATAIVKYGDAAKVQAVLKAHPVAAITMATDSVGGCGGMSFSDSPPASTPLIPCNPWLTSARLPVMYAGEPEDLSQWTTMWVKIWRKSSAPPPEGVKVGQKALDYLKANTRGLAHPFQSLIDWTPDGSDCYIDEMKCWVSQPFDNRDGRITMAGDAAHPMLIYRGQGFQHAILDASQYLDALIKVREGAGTRGQTISAYDADMIERGAKAVQQSLQEAEFSMDLKTVNNMLMAKKGHGQSA